AVPTASTAPLFPYTTLFRSPPNADRLDETLRRWWRCRAARRIRDGRSTDCMKGARRKACEPPNRSTYRAASGDRPRARRDPGERSEEHTSELQSRGHLVCRL